MGELSLRCKHARNVIILFPQTTLMYGKSFIIMQFSYFVRESWVHLFFLQYNGLWYKDTQLYCNTKIFLTDVCLCQAKHPSLISYNLLNVCFYKHTNIVTKFGEVNTSNGNLSALQIHIDRIRSRNYFLLFFLFLCI